jgi:hypothetical protein
MSESAFPALGSAAGPKKIMPPKSPLDFKKTVMTAPVPADSATLQATIIKDKKHVSMTRYGDDGPEDYDGPPEEEEEEDEEAEFNAHLASTRRRGDKGIW